MEQKNWASFAWNCCRPKMRWRRWLLTLILAAGVVFLATLRPRQVICLTTEHTYCPDHLQSLVSQLNKHPLVWAPRYYDTLAEQAKDQEPTLVKLRFHRNWDWSILATVEISPVILHFRAEGQDYSIRANGLAAAEDDDSQPPLILANPNQWLSTDRTRVQSLSPEQLKTLSRLHQQYQSFSPRITKITFISPTEIRLTPEGKGTIIVRSDESSWLDSQLTALQGFFRSSTIDTSYQELDARFADLVIR